MSDVCLHPRSTTDEQAAGPPVAAAWDQVSLKDRIECICALRHELAERCDEFLYALRRHGRTDVESIAGEIIPLADACEFLRRNAARLLRRQRLGSRGRPLWLRGVRSEIHREPLGRVLVIGPANYPLMLPGVQMIQALVAGNHVVFKPAPGTGAVATLLVRCLHDLGVPPDALLLLDEAPSEADAWFSRVDKVVMTGSEASGRAVLSNASAHLVPAVMELSGCDAVFVLPGFSLGRLISALRFGLTFNNSATCMAPRRLFIDDDGAEALRPALAAALAKVSTREIPPATADRLNAYTAKALTQGADLIVGSVPFVSGGTPLVLDHAKPAMNLLQEDVMAPVLSIVRVRSTEDAIAAYEKCRYSLGASVFGPGAEAVQLARRIRAGSVVINDLIAPTADPNLPLNAQKRSGFGVTRGAEGLLEMTRLKTIILRGKREPAHLRDDADQSAPILAAYLRAMHGRTLAARMKAWVRLAREGKTLSDRKKNQPS